MDTTQIRGILLEQHGLRIGPEMAAYVSRQLAVPVPAARTIAVIGGNARTGVPMRLLIDPQQLSNNSVDN